MHLIIDGYVRDPKKIQDKEFIYRFLDTYPSQIKMTKVSSPQVSQHVRASQSNHPGISGFVLLAESHISIHIFPERSYVNIDIFSCGDFDPEEAMKTIEREFGLIGARSYAINRPHADVE